MILNLFHNSPLIMRAWVYAAAAHAAVKQLRKYTNEPYITHPYQVALTVASVPTATEHMVAAAFLHDVVEDTGCTIDNIRDIFGREIASLVAALTDTEEGNRKERKAAACTRLGKSTPDVQTIKLADLLDNTSSIVKYDPDFARVYLKEKRDLLSVLTRGDKQLWQRASSLLAESEFLLNQNSSTKE